MAGLHLTCGTLFVAMPFIVGEDVARHGGYWTVTHVFHYLSITIH
ncbi:MULTISPECIES: hypothetical protein [Bacillus]|nr:MULTISPECIES: hypothetical protein [Bacillus]MCU4773409.1 hypothetical protein [Bacillus cereus]MCU4833550.1 hypothetical protein [Bacillus cereus]MCU4946021.1 hypothetical protein [Bacillus cereus]MCU5535601.1 hypothetical protein [Bacillus cereus]MCU5585742.1 hypothetical protein [Bacillus cereus]